MSRRRAVRAEWTTTASTSRRSVVTCTRCGRKARRRNATQQGWSLSTRLGHLCPFCAHETSSHTREDNP